MLLFKRVDDLQKYLRSKKDQGLQIGFVPTMGALHEGHLSLMNISKSKCDLTVCSIFVNPTQFNDPTDLEKYPRTIGADIDLLTSVGADVLFLPSTEEIYPKDLDTSIDVDFRDLSTVMEGAFRPGHFEGMAQVVWRLLNIVEPDQLFMGQKDFQQVTIVQAMLEQFNAAIELIRCPIVREEDGLAMSSRNVRLSPEQRSAAIALSKTLGQASEKMSSASPKEISDWALDALSLPDFKPEYFEIVDGMTLQPIDRFEDADFVVACTAVWVDKVRLIDNMILKES
jgi:pantoate--beta-alanine ligase